MTYVLLPQAVFAIVGLLCLDIKIGLLVGDAIGGRGITNYLFYVMTVIGLIAIELVMAFAIANYSF